MFRIAAPLGVLALMLVACGEVTKSGPPASIDFDVPTQHSMPAGAFHTMKVTVRDASGRALAGIPIVWKSSNSAIARVGSDGVLVADSSGTARITAIAATVSAVFDVTVVQSAELLDAAPSDTTIRFETRLPLRLIVYDGAGRPIPLPPEAYRFTTSDSAVAFVDAGAVLQTTGWGTASVTVDVAGLADTLVVTSLPYEPDLGGVQLVRLDSGWPSPNCGLDAAGVAYCWGSNANGELGRSGVIDPTAVLPVETGLRFVELSVGQSMSCGLTAAQEIWCWGTNMNGVLGQGPESVSGGATPIVSSITPLKVSGGHRWMHVSVGEHRTVCGVTDASEVYCWGHNDQEQVGRGPPPTSGDANVARISGAWTLHQVDVHMFGGCALTDLGAPVCWGILAPGARGSTADRSPAMVQGVPPLARIYAGRFIACGLTSQGDAYCWGLSTTRDLGRDLEGPYADHAPAPAVPGMRFSKLALAASGTCGITLQGRLHCWGNRFVWTGGMSQPPLRLGDPGMTFVDVDNSQGGICALTADARAFCW